MENAPERRERMETLALSPPEALEEILEKFPKFSEPVILRAPETGLVMVRGRTGGDGDAFCLGEALVSRAAVSIDGIVGFGMVLRSNSNHALNCAVLDALGRHPDSRERVREELARLSAKREEKIKMEEDRVKETRVEFFTMVRGDAE
ncbi:MAG: phosphonate C-P lyase system protein PhnG [Deltaproteobacteria bacterium]|jgi:alpha-D-ribose 1-methylphosphonate 5-triphosphate synthase subunit PhnG|nr:phosphonate C-P lyase system protein PhnG [Deltaproteobacteria bacterium]